MKKVLFLVGFVLMVLCLASCLNGSSGTESPQSIAPESLQKNVPQDYTDLGLPSGTIWRNHNAAGFYTYDEAEEQFDNHRLPSKTQWEELRAECDWSWTGSGYYITGPNGNSIFLPLTGCIACDGGMHDKSFGGYYWSSSIIGWGDKIYGLAFGSSAVGMEAYSRCNGFSVRSVLN